MPQQLRPPFPYYGGKITIGPDIARLFPDHTHYVEPFCGSAAVLLSKPPVAHETINDADLGIYTFWKVFRDQPDDLIRVCRLTPHSELEFAFAADYLNPDLPDLEKARRVWVRLTQGRSGRLRRMGFRYYIDPAGCSIGMPGYLDGYVDRMPAVVERLKNITLLNRNAYDIIDKFGRRKDVLLYCDPPYLGSTRNHDRSYHHEVFTDDEHRALAAALRACKSAVVLSGYPSDLYDCELFPDWDRHEIPTTTGQGAEFSARTEVVWSNRPMNKQTALFDAAPPLAAAGNNPPERR